jgi:hypothetical protein
MKNKIFFKSIAAITLFWVIPFIAKAQVPTYKCELKNCVQLSPTEYSFDIYLLRTGTTPFEFAGMQMGIKFNNEVIPAGAIITPTISGRFTVNACNSNKQANIRIVGTTTKGIKITIPTPLCGPGNGSLISNMAPGDLVCQVKITSSIPFVTKTPFNLSWNFVVPQPWATKVFYYPPNSKGGADCTNEASHTVGK